MGPLFKSTPIYICTWPLETETHSYIQNIEHMFSILYNIRIYLECEGEIDTIRPGGSPFAITILAE